MGQEIGEKHVERARVGLQPRLLGVWTLLSQCGTPDLPTRVGLTFEFLSSKAFSD